LEKIKTQGEEGKRINIRRARNKNEKIKKNKIK
jgi:hypothetical protein